MAERPLMHTLPKPTSALCLGVRRGGSQQLGRSGLGTQLRGQAQQAVFVGWGHIEGDLEHLGLSLSDLRDLQRLDACRRRGSGGTTGGRPGTGRPRGRPGLAATTGRRGGSGLQLIPPSCRSHSPAALHAAAFTLAISCFCCAALTVTALGSVAVSVRRVPTTVSC